MRHDDTGCADREAVDWVILLRECPDDLEAKQRFDDWLKASDRNTAAWEDAAYAYQVAGSVRPAYSPVVRTAEPGPLLPGGRQRPASLRRERRRSRAMGPPTAFRWTRTRSAVSGVAAVVALVFGSDLSLSARADYTTGVGQLRRVSLADGSIAELAPQSAIAVTYAANRRQIRLLRGQAWFDVRHDPARPFYVQSDGIDTRVLGTAFDVERDARGVTTEVARGLVRVTYAAATAPPVAELVRPGEVAHVDFDGRVVRTTKPKKQVGAWRERKLIVYDRSIDDVVEAIRPWYGGVIILRGAALDRRRVTGVYNVANPVLALEGLARTFGGSVTSVTPWVMILTIANPKEIG